MRTLVVIDVQNPYLFSGDACICGITLDFLDNVSRLVSLFNSMGWPIVVVETFDQDHTSIHIKNAIKNNDDVFFVKKSMTDGSSEIIECIDSHDLPSNLVVCGLFADYSVKDTIVGLLSSQCVDVDVVVDSTLNSTLTQEQIHSCDYFGLSVRHHMTENFIDEVKNETM